MQTMEEFIKENGLCTVCAGAKDLWNGDPEQDAPICWHCKGKGLEPHNKACTRLLLVVRKIQSLVSVRKSG